MLLLIQCIVCCVVFTLIILPAQYKDPLCMIASYPPEVRKRVSELPQYKDVAVEKEKKHKGKKVFGIFFFAGVLAAVAYASGCRSFFETFFHVFVLFFAVNIYDMVVLDWGVFCHSQKLRIPGTEDMDKEYKNKLFHVRGAAIGCMLGIIVASLSGCIVHLVLL
ncbi:MAG: hypothetical protein IJ429_05160 [Lachnospiraceae bacterium]|nr:hypothetical protein [Lachnospiraceae bacterium]